MKVHGYREKKDMGATIVSLIFIGFVFIFSILREQLPLECILSKEFLTYFLGVFLLISFLPWRWVLYPKGAETSTVVYQTGLKARLADKKVYALFLGIFIIIFSTLLFVNFSSIGYAYRCTLGLLSIGILIDMAQALYKRLNYCQMTAGIAEYLLCEMKKAERKKDLPRLMEEFETTFSLITAFLQSADRVSLQVFCRTLSGNLDFWIRATSHIPGSKNGMGSEAFFLDRYSLVEAMVAKRMSFCISEALERGDFFAFEVLIHLYGKFSLAFHKKHASLGYLTLISLSQALQHTEGKLDHMEIQVEFITMLSEVIKAYIDHTLVTKVSDKEAIFRTFALLEAHIKESFRLDRQINPAFLMQPFAEVGQLIGEESYQYMPDREIIVSELRRMLAQFAALEGVRAKMDIGVEGTDTKASYHEDKPFLKDIGL